MDTAEVAVVVGLQEDVSTKMPGVTNSLSSVRTSMRELAMGTMYLGTTFIGLGAAMSASNNSTVKSASNMLMMAGGIATAIGSAVHFVEAAGKIAHALQAVNLQLMLQKALSGPLGWAMLAGGAAVAGGAIYKMNQSSGGGSSQAQTITVKSTVVLDKKVVGETVRTETIKTQKRNGNSSGIRQ